MSPSGASSEILEVSSGPSRLRVARTGAELLSAEMAITSSASSANVLSRVDSSVEFICFGGETWPHHAPVLFPAICRHPDDTITVDGRPHRLGHHGFLRDFEFSVVSHADAEVVLRATATAETHSQYPFSFVVDIAYRAVPTGFQVDFIVTNSGSYPMPYGLGWHPAFRRTNDDRPSVTWEEAPEHVHRVRENLLTETIHPPPHHGSVWPADASQFSAGGLICPVPVSSSVRCRLGGGRSVEMSWRGFDHLTLWSPPTGEGTSCRSAGDADLLCVEPWRGLPARADWTGEESDRVDLAKLNPGDSAAHTVRCTLSVSETH